MFLSIIQIFTGFFAAMAHVLSGPDHLAAVTPFAIEEKKKAWKIGMFWGAGHITGMLLIGILFGLFKDYFPIEKVSSYSETIVGFILIGIGIWVISKAFEFRKKTKHLHVHSDEHSFIHTHDNASKLNHNHSHDEHHKTLAKNSQSAFFVGTIHGFAGVAHFILFLPILGFTSNLEVGSYIIGFALGTIVAMVLFAIILGKASAYLNSSNPQKALKYLRFSSGVLAIAIGLYWIMYS